MRCRRPAGPRRRGATIVEAAIVLNVFLLLIFGIFEFGRFFMFRQLIDNAAREAARYATSGTDNLTAALIQKRARDYLVGPASGYTGTPTVQVYKSSASGTNLGAWDDAGFGERIAVRIDATYKPLVPKLGILPSSIPVRAWSIMRSEGD